MIISKYSTSVIERCRRNAMRPSDPVITVSSRCTRLSGAGLGAGTVFLSEPLELCS